MRLEGDVVVLEEAVNRGAQLACRGARGREAAGSDTVVVRGTDLVPEAVGAPHVLALGAGVLLETPLAPGTALASETAREVIKGRRDDQEYTSRLPS